MFTSGFKLPEFSADRVTTEPVHPLPNPAEIYSKLSHIARQRMANKAKTDAAI